MRKLIVISKWCAISISHRPLVNGYNPPRKVRKFAYFDQFKEEKNGVAPQNLDKVEPKDPY